MRIQANNEPIWDAEKGFLKILVQRLYLLFDHFKQVNKTFMLIKEVKKEDRHQQRLWCCFCFPVVMFPLFFQA